MVVLHRFYCIAKRLDLTANFLSADNLVPGRSAPGLKMTAFDQQGDVWLSIG